MRVCERNMYAIFSLYDYMNVSAMHIDRQIPNGHVVFFCFYLTHGPQAVERLH